MGQKGRWLYFCGGVLAGGIAVFFALAGIAWALDVNLTKAVQLARFFVTLRYVETQYVEDVDTGKLMDGAISGMVKSLGDPHSLYLDPAMYQKLKNHANAQFGGIGVVMGFEDGVKILSVMSGTPGEAAGLKVGDKILAVDGTPTETLGREEVALHIRGEVGTEVTLTIRRAGEEVKEYPITRDYIHVRTAAGQMLPKDIGYLRITSFAEHTAEEFGEAYDHLMEGGMKGLVLDLRANPGGYITSCVEIAKRLVPKGIIVSVVERDGTRQEYDSTLTEAGIPLVVLIDHNSASASEILAGALQDTGAATIVGETSYGKGSVQVVMPMPGAEDAVKLTVAKYYTPNGRSINGVGVEPDVPVKAEEGAAEDLQLKKALTILEEKVQALSPAP